MGMVATDLGDVMVLSADGCPLSGGNRTPRVQRGIDALDPNPSFRR
jgi:hypothetical protein